MSKSVVFSLIASAVFAFAAESAFAGGGSRACSASCAAPAPHCATYSATTHGGAPATPANPHAGMDMSQANSRPTYQSFSYEPGGSQPVVITEPTNSAPRATYAPSNRTYRQSPSFYDTVRGDRKVRGL